VAVGEHMVIGYVLDSGEVICVSCFEELDVIERETINREPIHSEDSTKAMEQAVRDGKQYFITGFFKCRDCDTFLRTDIAVI